MTVDTFVEHDDRPPIPRPPAEPAVVVEHVVRRFGGRAVLQDISFNVAPSTAFGIAGANGSGKTVLLRLIASLDRPTSGRITIHGYDTMRRARAVRDRIGYVPEEPMLYDGLSAEQYLQFVGRARGLGKQVRQVAVDTLLQVVGLEERRWRDVSAFSPGERRRLALASALVHEPDVLLLDDPLRGLDGFARLEQIEVLRELHRLGLDGLEAGLALLGQRRDLRELEVDEDGRNVWFLFTGDQETLANLLPQLIRAGCSVAHFGIERRSPASALARMFHEGSG